MLLRDVIDLDATFGGAGTDGDMPDDINSDAMINAGEDAWKPMMKMKMMMRLPKVKATTIMKMPRNRR